jgi:hypothetical protein
MCVTNYFGCGNQLPIGIVDFMVTGTVNGTMYTFEIHGGYKGPGTNMFIAVSPGSSINPDQLWEDKLTGGKVNLDGNHGTVVDSMNPDKNTSGIVHVSGTFA